MRLNGKYLMPLLADIKEMKASGAITLSHRKLLATKYKCGLSNITLQVHLSAKLLPMATHAAPSLKERVSKRDKNTCQYCGQKSGNLIVEHVLPTARGGIAADFNLVIACQKCNTNKRSSVWIPRNMHKLVKSNRMWSKIIYRLATVDSRTIKDLKRAIPKLKSNPPAPAKTKKKK